MINCANFNYNWHLNYTYTDDVAPLIPAGTILHVITWHDNSQANRNNPDPKNWVGDGQRTIDEMGFAWIGWYDLSDEEYKAELDARKAERQKKSDHDAAAATAAVTESTPGARRAAGTRRRHVSAMSQRSPSFSPSISGRSLWLLISDRRLRR